ncbi:uncharacterized protein LOC124269706 isoform X2 [Haliotis rubra]|uniref:uncharacterized protein LOC124269706 isoform X2 n=2 Tax=Haliotis rubra TaxID=36100 RepID=UPI001EE59748|nr:uncharacterized protein LOC124269706 isoform X2 [Haliotis rubra]
MGVKVSFVLALVLCFCAFGYSTPVVKKCEKMDNGALVEEDCEDGTGVSSVAGEADNVFVGVDVKGRRVFKVAGNETCFIVSDPAPLPADVTEATMDQTKTPVLVTDQAVLDSVREWCTGDVYVLVADDTAVTGDRHKRAICYRVVCRYYIYYGRLYRHCRIYLFRC